jgi:CubicO group peptidase (beta-lactamase class C family)
MMSPLFSGSAPGARPRWRGAVLAAAFLGLTAACCPAQRLKSERLREAADYSRSTGQVALLVWQGGGQKVREISPQLKRQEGLHDVRSVVKSLWALAALKAAEEGRVSLDGPVAQWLPEWRDDGRGALTLRQMLAMTSGLEPSATAIYREGFRDLNRISLAVPQTLPAGKAFRYGPAGYEAGWEVLRRGLATKGLPLEVWYAEHLARPLGAAPPWLKRDETGRPFASAGARARPEDLQEIGVMLARDGKAGPFGRVLSEASVDAAFQGSPANPAYGLGFWLNRQAAAAEAVEAFPEDLVDLKPAEVDWSRVCLCRAAPADLAAMLGSSGQRVYVSRSMRLVVVRLGEGKAFRDGEFLRHLFGG